MYRRTLALLWTGTILFLILAVIDALLGFMGHMQGLFIGAMAACFVSIWIRVGHHENSEATCRNRQKAEQIRADVDQLRNQIAEVRDLTEAHIIGDEARKHDQNNAETSAEAQDAVIYQFRLRHPDGHDVIVGKRTREPIDNTEEFLRALDANDTSTLPGHFSAS